MKNLKRTIMCCIILTLIIQTAIAQNPIPRELHGIKSERKGEKETFIIIQQGNSLLIFNKTSTLIKQQSRFEEMLGYGGSNPVKFYDRPKLNSLVSKHIMPFYRDFKSAKYSDDISAFLIYLYSGMDGRVREMVFISNIDAKLPLNALEKLEQEILASNFKLDFDPNHSFFKGSTWVYTWDVYTVESMKKKLKEKEKN